MTPGRLVRAAVLLEGALVALGLVVVSWTGDRLELPELGAGPVTAPWIAAATLPLLLGAGLLLSPAGQRWRPARRLHDRLEPLLSEMLPGTTVGQLTLVGLAAGLGEEFLFRGVLEPLWGTLPAAVVFGLAHALTPTYFVIATLLGLFMSGLVVVTGGLAVPIGVHALYDIVVLVEMRDRIAAEGGWEGPDGRRDQGAPEGHPYDRDAGNRRPPTA